MYTNLAAVSVPLRKKLSISEAKQRISKYCAYQERCHQEVRDKLYGFGLNRDDVEYVIYELIQNDFLNEERFAIAFVRGKFNYKKWGRLKIERELVARKISVYCIRKGMKEISNDAYRTTVFDLLEKKLASLTDDNDYIERNKAAQYMIRKGYEPELVWACIREME